MASSKTVVSITNTHTAAGNGNMLIQSGRTYISENMINIIKISTANHSKATITTINNCKWPSKLEMLIFNAVQRSTKDIIISSFGGISGCQSVEHTLHIVQRRQYCSITITQKCNIIYLFIMTIVHEVHNN